MNVLLKGWPDKMKRHWLKHQAQYVLVDPIMYLTSLRYVNQQDTPSGEAVLVSMRQKKHSKFFSKSLKSHRPL